MKRQSPLLRAEQKRSYVSTQFGSEIFRGASPDTETGLWDVMTDGWRAYRLKTADSEKSAAKPTWPP